MRKILIPLFLFGTAVMMYLMVQTSALLKTPVTPAGIINLELANNTAKTTAIINAWAPNADSEKKAVQKDTMGEMRPLSEKSMPVFSITSAMPATMAALAIK